MKIALIVLLFISVQAFGQKDDPDNDYYDLVLHSLDSLGTITSHDLTLKFGPLYKTTEPGIFVADEKAKKLKRLLQKLDDHKWAVYGLDSDNLVDINFDGYKDLKLFCEVCGGAHNATEYVYVFNSRTNTYEFSSKLTGNDIEIDAAKKTVTETSNFSGGEYAGFKLKFSNKGKILYTQNFSCEVLNADKRIKKYSYKKIIGGKLVFSRSKTVVDTGDATGFFDWLGKYEQ